MAIEIKVPALGESIVEATIGEWLKQAGDTVTAGEPLVRLETDKVDLEVNAEQAGVLTTIARQAGEDVNVGDVLGTLEAGAAAAPAEARTAQPGPAPTDHVDQADGAATERAADDNITPVARRVAAEQGIDPAHVSGSGPGGRVTKQDVQSYAAQQTSAPAAPAAPEPSSRPAPAAREPAPSPSPAAERPEERIRMSRRRQTIARRLVEAQQTAAMLTTFNEIDLSAVMDMRSRRKDSFKEQHGIGLGFMSFFTKASIGALKVFPQLNAEIRENEIVLKHYYDIGIAIGAAEGLVVPVIRNADRLSFAGIERAIKELARKVDDGTLSVEDLRGGTFTITNGGIFGSLLSTPILNLPQVAILGMHKIEPRPVVVKGEIVVRPMMYVALSYDHRIVDGREAVQFLVRVKELIEDPETLLLEG